MTRSRAQHTASRRTNRERNSRSDANLNTFVSGSISRSSTSRFSRSGRIPTPSRHQRNRARRQCPPPNLPTVHNGIYTVSTGICDLNTRQTTFVLPGQTASSTSSLSPSSSLCHNGNSDTTRSTSWCVGCGQRSRTERLLLRLTVTGLLMLLLGVAVTVTGFLCTMSDDMKYAPLAVRTVGISLGLCGSSFFLFGLFVFVRYRAHTDPEEDVNRPFRLALYRSSIFTVGVGCYLSATGIGMKFANSHTLAIGTGGLMCFTIGLIPLIYLRAFVNQDFRKLTPPSTQQLRSFRLAASDRAHNVCFDPPPYSQPGDPSSDSDPPPYTESDPTLPPPFLPADEDTDHDNLPCDPPTYEEAISIHIVDL